MDKIIGIGNALVDALALVDNDSILKEIGLYKGGMQLIGPDMLASINEKFANTPRRITTGGAACNTMMALAQLGMKPGVVGMIGRDRFGTLFKQSFIEAGADVRLQECDLPTGVASTFITPDGQRTFGTCLGAAGNMKPEDLTDDIFKGYDILFVEGYLVQDHSLISRILEIGKAAGMRICLDMASYNIVEHDRDFLQHIVDRYVDIVFANEDEAYAFTQLSEQDAVADLARRCEVAVVKVGARGAYIRQGYEQVHVPAKDVHVIDTNAAGDYFAAGFLYGHVRGCSLETCGRIGAELSGNIIQVVGTKLEPEVWDEIKLNIKAILSE